MSTLPPVDHQQYLIALGRIAVNMNALESWARTSTLFILGKETGGFVLASSMTDNFSRVLTTLRFAFHFKVSDENHLKRFDDLCQEFERLYAERNRYLHSVWLFAPDHSYVSRMKNLKWPKIDYDTQPDCATLNTLADKLGTAHEALFKLIFEVFPNPLATPTTA
jgi:hypothetical protein